MGIAFGHANAAPKSSSSPTTNPSPQPPVNRLDTTYLGTLGSLRATPTPENKQTQNRSKAIAADEPKFDEKAEKELYNTILSLTTVLDHTPPGVLRNRVLLDRAIANGYYGREKLLRAKHYEMTAEVKKYLNMSVQDALTLINTPGITNDLLVRAHDAAATSSLYLENNELAREHFLIELKLGPPPEKAGRIALVIAEQYFDQGDFKSAADYYTRYYAQMSPQWKEISVYKTGWCMINLKQPEQAEAFFLKIAHATSFSGLGRDAIRDLAYLTSSKSGSVPEIFRTEEKFTLLQDKLLYLGDVLINTERLSFPAEHDQVARRLLQLETNPASRVNVLLSQLRLQKKPYASRNHLTAFRVLADYLAKVNKADLKLIMERHESSMEMEMENIFRAYVDTYVGRLKVMEDPPLTPTQVVDAIKTFVQFFKVYFPTTPHFPAIVELWENLCIDNKDWAGVDDITQFILTNLQKIKPLLEGAYLNQIAALDQLGTDKERRSLRVKEFVEKFPKSPKWSEVAKIYAQNETRAGHFKVALKVGAQIMDVEPNEENFYQLQFSRFKYLDYDAVLNDPRNKTYLVPQSHFMELYRETSLKAAEIAKQANKPNEYRKHIENFIRLSTDADKARIARIDYFKYLIQSDQLEEANTRYGALPPEEKKSPMYEAFRSDLWKAAVDKEMYELAVESAANSQQLLLSTLLQGGALDAKTFEGLTSAEKDYFLGLYALFDPDFTINYLLKKMPFTPQHRDLMILSQRINKNQWQLIRTPELEKLLGKSYSFLEAQVLKPLPIEKSIASVQFPELGILSAQKQARTVQVTMEHVRKNRQWVVDAVSGKAPEIQFRVLNEMRELEDKMGAYLMNSPIPLSLNTQQVQQYKEGLKAASDEFVQQDQQFKLLADKAKETIDKNLSWLDRRTFPVPEMSKWPWPDTRTKTYDLNSVYNLVKKGNIIGAIALLDFIYSSAAINPKNFALVRTGIILKSKPSQALRIYLLDELEKNKQTEVIKIWSSLTNHPVPEAQ